MNPLCIITHSICDECFSYSIPQQDPSGQSLIISGADFERIKAAALINTKQRHQYWVEHAKQEREKAMVS